MVDGLHALHRAGEHGRIAGVALQGLGGAQRLQRLRVARGAKGAHLLSGLREERDEALALVPVSGCDKDQGGLLAPGLAVVTGLTYKSGRIHTMPSAL